MHIFHDMVVLCLGMRTSLEFYSAYCVGISETRLSSPLYLFWEKPRGRISPSAGKLPLNVEPFDGDEKGPGNLIENTNVKN